MECSFLYENEDIGVKPVKTEPLCDKTCLIALVKRMLSSIIDNLFKMSHAVCGN